MLGIHPDNSPWQVVAHPVVNHQPEPVWIVAVGRTCGLDECASARNIDDFISTTVYEKSGARKQVGGSPNRIRIGQQSQSFWPELRFIALPKPVRFPSAEPFLVSTS